ncbi:Hypothetical protein SRAE_1000078000 [Strongyloides ratti]|uniref:Uncharacterized protein n=1 Tax=Strongyloides ratti TaxID=34506 RepID=A0A090KYB1_STRRB|nr:Hypothetical protein SRAE_1000078000 [Strongyloides ratti]CEF62510.1 Hypothetical protein SRAE_1000078000 [Strongyloides ratti]
MNKYFFTKLFILIILLPIIYGINDSITCTIECDYKDDIKNLAKDFCEQEIFEKESCLSKKEDGCMSFYFKSQVIDGKRISFRYKGCYNSEFINFAKNMNFTDFPLNKYIDSTIKWKGYNFYVFGSRNTIKNV